MGSHPGPSRAADSKGKGPALKSGAGLDEMVIDIAYLPDNGAGDLWFTWRLTRTQAVDSVRMTYC